MTRPFIDQVQQNTKILSELFPAAFVSERWMPHRPLRTGIHKDLEALGILTSLEISAVLRVYTNRPVYLLACLPGTPRVDLQGNPAGAVTEQEAQYAAKSLAGILAKRQQRADAAKAEHQAKLRERRESRANAPTAATMAPTSPQVTAPPSASTRAGLSDLRASAARRRAEAEQKFAQNPVRSHVISA